MKIKLALAQHPGSLNGRLPADIVLFPELVDGGYAALADHASPHTLDDAYVRKFADATDSSDGVVVAGSVFLKHGRSGGTNTSLAFRRGKCINRYDKIHLFRPTRDHRYFLPGRKAQTFSVTLGGRRLRIGIVICFDLRFPELIRSLAFRGMDLLLVPARWPAVRTETWKTLLRARAIENQVFVAGCNAEGPEGGPSFVFGPTGNPVPTIVRPGTRSVKIYTLDFGEMEKAKKLYDAIKEARWRRR